MSTQVSALAGSIHAAPAFVNRPTGNYHPALWGDHFLSCISHSDAKNASDDQDEYEGLKQEVRRMLSDDVKSETYQKLRLIDAVQRLGVAYHFKSELEDALMKIYHNQHRDEFDDLYTTSLRFRLLRQQGFKISCDAFEKFKDGEGKFKSSLCHDVSGMLSLYEAAYLGIRGEDILDEAIAFTTTNLKSMLAQLNPQQAEEISRALDRPIRKWLERLEARHYMTVYARDESHDMNLLKFAKLDFNILQAIHKRELNGIIEWWKSLEVAIKLPYCRDRIVECYSWIMGVYFEPQYSLARKMLTKIIAVASILDDTYDNYGTWEELELLTEAIQRWDIRADIDLLSEKMQLVCRILFDVYNEIKENLAKEGELSRVHYGKEAMKRVAQYYLAEAKWRTEGYIPTFEEYMDVAQVSTCYPMLTISSFLGMGPIATIEVFEWASKDPKIVKASSVICRLMDDIVSHEFEQERAHVASGLECYINQHGISEDEVIKLFRKEIANAWKDINEECLQPTAVPLPLLERVLNFSRAIDVIYKDGDGYTNAHIIKDYIALLIKDPATI